MRQSGTARFAARVPSSSSLASPTAASSRHSSAMPSPLKPSPATKCPITGTPQQGTRHTRTLSSTLGSVISGFTPSGRASPVSPASSCFNMTASTTVSPANTPLCVDTSVLDDAAPMFNHGTVPLDLEAFDNSYYDHHTLALSPHNGNNSTPFRPGPPMRSNGQVTSCSPLGTPEAISDWPSAARQLPIGFHQPRAQRHFGATRQVFSDPPSTTLTEAKRGMHTVAGSGAQQQRPGRHMTDAHDTQRRAMHCDPASTGSASQAAPQRRQSTTPKPLCRYENTVGNAPSRNSRTDPRPLNFAAHTAKMSPLPNEASKDGYVIRCADPRNGAKTAVGHQSEESAIDRPPRRKVPCAVVASGDRMRNIINAVGVEEHESMLGTKMVRAEDVLRKIVTRATASSKSSGESSVEREMVDKSAHDLNVVLARVVHRSVEEARKGDASSRGSAGKKKKAVLSVARVGACGATVVRDDTLLLHTSSRSPRQEEKQVQNDVTEGKDAEGPPTMPRPYIVDSFDVDLRAGDLVLLGSPGVFGLLSGSEITRYLGFVKTHGIEYIAEEILIGCKARQRQGTRQAAASTSKTTKTAAERTIALTEAEQQADLCCVLCMVTTEGTLVSTTPPPA